MRASAMDKLEASSCIQSTRGASCFTFFLKSYSCYSVFGFFLSVLLPTSKECSVLLIYYSRTWFLSCTGFPDCRYAIWLPDAVISARPVQADALGVDCMPANCLPCQSSCPSKRQRTDVSSSLVALKFRTGTLLPGGYVQEKPETE